MINPRLVHRSVLSCFRWPGVVFRSDGLRKYGGVPQGPVERPRLAVFHIPRFWTLEASHRSVGLVWPRVPGLRKSGTFAWVCYGPEVLDSWSATLFRRCGMDASFWTSGVKDSWVGS